MIDYHELEQAVFDYLYEKYKANPEFTFSVRQSKSKGAEWDIFIGKESTGYFAFTLWDIRVGYRGAPGDLCGFELKMRKEFWFMKFFFHHSKESATSQQKLNIALGKEALKRFQEINSSKFQINYNGQRSDFYFEIFPHENQYFETREILDALQRLIDFIEPEMDKLVAKHKKNHPEWQGERYQSQKFRELIEKMETRRSNPLPEAPNIQLTAPKKGNFKKEVKPYHPLPLNLILYGPPGTGKTYKLRNLFDQFTTERSLQSQKQFLQSLVTNRPWWEVLAAALFDLKKAKVPELMKHPLVEAKFAESDIQHPSQRVWSTLQIHTVDNCPNVALDPGRRHGVSIFFKEKDSVWRLDDIKNFSEELPGIAELSREAQTGPKTEKSIRRYKFTTCHQSLAYEDFIEGIKPKMMEDEEIETDGHLRYTIEKGIFYQACEEAAKLAGYSNLKECLEDSMVERERAFAAIKDDPDKQYAIFLDEINRSNISAVFGELITLIEEDKRLGADQEIIIHELPYSKKPFGVPPNLYVFGAMNTADRSVEALDTALRRRFVFEEMPPKPELVSPKGLMALLYQKYTFEDWDDEEFRAKADALYQFLGITQEAAEGPFIEQKAEKGRQWSIADFSHLGDEDFSGLNPEKLLTIINDRIEKLLDKNYRIGHSYFMSLADTEEPVQELRRIFQNKILPLVQEYFYGDLGRISLVIGKDFFEPNGSVVKFMQVGDWYDAGELSYRRVVRFKDLIHSDKDEFGDDEKFLELVKKIYDQDAES